ncbi:zinc finger protein 271-like [Sabethes cyaneus]|uniref:zinc finger protein 271-like n=1 Tax=Sabethes cyaneus TaxID=53552 RepID=UPI00237D63E7|nr:zinc finger protein 271-like [Sabethes cyaneus]
MNLTSFSQKDIRDYSTPQLSASIQPQLIALVVSMALKVSKHMEKSYLLEKILLVQTTEYLEATNPSLLAENQSGYSKGYSTTTALAKDCSGQIECDALEAEKSPIDGNSHTLEADSPTGSGSQRKHICDICGASFKLGSGLSRHNKVHRTVVSNPYECDLCSKSFSTVQTLKIHHILKHTTEKNFKCDICGKEYHLSAHLKQHLKNHNPDQTFECDICGASYKTATGLRLHKRMHALVEPKPYECDQCGTRFVCKSGVNRHKKMKHSQFKKPVDLLFKCDLCSKAYASNRTLQNHRITHTTEKNFKCNICARDVCDEIIAKSPDTFNAAYTIAHSLEATRNTTRDINTGTPPPAYPKATNKLGYEKPRTRKSPQSRQRLPLFQQRTQVNPYIAGESRPCNGCGGQHLINQCRFHNVWCNACGKKGHIAKVCRSEKSQNSSTDLVESQETPTSETDFVQSLHQVLNVSSTGKKPIDVEIDGRRLQMELDTGAPCGIIGANESAILQLHWTSHTVPWSSPCASIHRMYIAQIKLISPSTHSRAPNLLRIKQLTCRSFWTTSTTIFSDIPGKLEGPPAKVHLKPGTSPVFARARDVPFALRDRYAAEIDKKLASGFYEKVDYSE